MLPRYLSMGCGWTTDAARALVFWSREGAVKTLRGRPGEIVKCTP